MSTEVDTKIDCTNYKNCPKEIPKPKLLDYTDETEKNSFDFLFVGCWGVYCSGKGTTVKSYNKKKDIFEEDKKTRYGQKEVVDSMVTFSKENKQDAVILAGDNVYNDNDPIENVKEEVIKAGKKLNDNEKIPDIIDFFLKKIDAFPKEVTKDVVLSYLEKIKSEENKINKKIKKVFKQVKSQLLNMPKQLDKGFEKCMGKVETDNFFIGVGNHDIENCDVINEQLNYKNTKWKMPALSYNVLVKMNGFNVNLIFIDTNMYDDAWCQGAYPEDAKNNQEKWLESVLSESENTWNIVIGHLPFACDPHKQVEDKTTKLKVTKLRTTAGLLELIQKNTSKIDLYMCADEHCQHYVEYKIRDDIFFPPEVVAGSGGTKLEDKIWKFLPDDQAKLRRVTFGYVSVKVSAKELALTFHSVQVYEKSDGESQVAALEKEVSMLEKMLADAKADGQKRLDQLEARLAEAEKAKKELAEQLTEKKRELEDKTFTINKTDRNKRI